MARSSVLIFSGYNQRGVIAFCRFCKSENIAFSVVADGFSDTILSTDYRENVIEIRNEKDLKVKDLVNYIRKAKSLNITERIVLLPSTEYLNRFCLRNRTELEKENLIVPLCEEDLYESISDKYSFGKICSHQGITIPEEYDFEHEFKFPVVAKPKKYFTKRNEIFKPEIIHNEATLKSFQSALEDDVFYLQKFIGGKSFYLLYYFPQQGEFSCYAQENLIQQVNGRSIIAAKSIEIPSTNLVDAFASMLSGFRFRGLLMIELKFFEGKFYMIEANPRLWGPSQLIIDSCMNLFHLFAYDFGLIAKVGKKQFKKNIYYFWSGGIFEDERSKSLPVFHDYNERKFFAEYYEWTCADVYMRNDTSKIFQSELTC